MKILSLELINFKNHKHAFFQFANINHFFGENFTGKTSIGDAIVFGLFGVTKYLQKSYVSDFIREGTNSMTVKISVEIKGNILEITRRIFGNKQQLEVNSNPVSQNELNKYLGKPQSFIYCFFPDIFPEEEKKEARSYIIGLIESENTHLFLQVEKEIQNKLKKQRSLQQSISFYKGQLALLEKQLGAIKHTVQTPKNSSNAHQTSFPDDQEIQQVSQQLIVLNHEKTNIEKEIAKIENNTPLQIGDKCPTCHQQVFSNQITIIIKEHEEKIQQLNEKLNKIKQEMKEKQATLHQLKEKKEQYLAENTIHIENSQSMQRTEQLLIEKDNVTKKLASLNEQLNLNKKAIAEQKHYLAKIANLMQTKVNNELKYSKIILFKQLKSGELRPDFQIKYNDLPFRMLSTSEKLRCMLEIIQMFQNFQQTTYPIFIDNLEGITHLDPPETQIFTASVKKGARLTLIKK